jgi:hypothetical protein
VAFQNAATIVVAQIFQLIDPSGVIVGNFQATGGPVAGPTLSFLHNDSLTTDSFLFWSEQGQGGFGTGSEELYLSGPEGVGQVGVPPALVLGRDAAGVKNAGLQGFTEGFLIGSNAAGTATSEIDIHGSTSSIDIFANVSALRDATAAGTSRGNLYGLRTYQGTLGVVTAIAAFPQTMVTVVVSSQPVSGGALIIHGYIRCTATVGWSCVIDGVTHPVIASTGVAAASGSQTFILNGMVAKAAAFNVSLVATAGTVGSNVTAETNLAILQYA